MHVKQDRQMKEATSMTNTRTVEEVQNRMGFVRDFKCCILIDQVGKELEVLPL
jgi:hypothetical protein